MEIDMMNLAAVVCSELRAMMIPNIQLYQSGNMRVSTQIGEINDEYIDIIISVPYASFTNTRGKMTGWIERTVDRVCRAYADGNNVENSMINGTIIYGG